MTVKTYKEKAPTLQAIEVTSILTQAAEIANLIGAVSLSIDMGTSTATFVDAKGKSTSVGNGYVIATLNGTVLVTEAAAFYAKYEVVN